MLCSRLFGSPDDVVYWKNVLQLFILVIASAWLIHSMFTGKRGDIKQVVSGSA